MKPNQGEKSTEKRRLELGLTLVELLIAMTLSLLLAIAAVSQLLASRRGFTAVDDASQLRDSARFAAAILQRVTLQAGFKDVLYAATSRTAQASAAPNPDTGVFGANNAVPDPANPAHSFIAGGLNGSDVLITRFQVPETSPRSGQADASMITCLGESLPAAALPKDRDDMVTNVLYVASFHGHPSLMCLTVRSDGAASTPQPILDGVDTFQVLYGTDGVTPSAAPTAQADSVPDRLLRADQLTLTFDPAATAANWRRVRSIRIGLVLHGSSKADRSLPAQTFMPLGALLASSADQGSTYSAPPDGLLRQALTFTVHLRNDQGV